MNKENNGSSLKLTAIRGATTLRKKQLKRFEEFGIPVTSADDGFISNFVISALCSRK